MALKRLTELSCGEMARVCRLEGDADVCRRLRSIGISEDSKVRRAFESPFGDPVAYEVQGILVADVYKRQSVYCIPADGR